ncbi:hypothetical protein B0H16DRAFT_311162 [Mycena metata]|uniref:Uncharacterized protein n=1 Tax=Mycena metata TaxID=1033252 RepID=A0AAD7NMY6_9AGAR|nr:hypothetical protein B0H16DRAFT_311162 [Mycena metata]
MLFDNPLHHHSLTLGIALTSIQGARSLKGTSYMYVIELTTMRLPAASRPAMSCIPPDGNILIFTPKKANPRISTAKVTHPPADMPASSFAIYPNKHWCLSRRWRPPDGCNNFFDGSSAQKQDHVSTLHAAPLTPSLTPTQSFNLKLCIEKSQNTIMHHLCIPVPAPCLPVCPPNNDGLHQRNNLGIDAHRDRRCPYVLHGETSSVATEKEMEEFMVPRTPRPIKTVDGRS